MNEHDLQKRIVQCLRIKGCTTVCTDMPLALMFYGKDQKKRISYINYINGQGFTKGQSDIIVIKNGKVIFVEVKKWSIGKNGKVIGKTKQSTDQIEFQRKIEEQGLTYILIDSPDKEQELYDLVQ